MLQQMKEVDKYWSTLLMSLSEGNQTDYQVWESLEVLEFYRRMDTWKERMQQRIDQIKNKK